MSLKYPEKKIIAVLPAYNAEKTLKKTVEDIPLGWVDQMVLVDDCSNDNTVLIAKELGLVVIQHKINKGYGGNQKTCYQHALKLGADIIVMVHPDHQYDPRLIPELLLPIIKKDALVVFGSRMMQPGAARDGGMPWWKYIANIFLTKLANTVLNLKLSEYHSGFRAYSKEALSKIDFLKNSDNFIFDTEIIIQLKIANINIAEIPIFTRYFPDASSIGFIKSFQYGLSIIANLIKYFAFKVGLITKYNS